MQGSQFPGYPAAHSNRTDNLKETAQKTKAQAKAEAVALIRLLEEQLRYAERAAPYIVYSNSDAPKG
ncbi:MAG: hypothetical protein LLG04_09610 [Parachlamydia sp.]|nr:hypothetical protein [Parachlamydia sp.]